jgi:hypothetical protein
MAVNPVAIAVRPERHKRVRRGEKIAHPSRMDSGIAPTDHIALMIAYQDSQLHRNRLHRQGSGATALRHIENVDGRFLATRVADLDRRVPGFLVTFSEKSLFSGTVQLRALPGGNRGEAPTICSLWLLNGLAFNSRPWRSVSRLMLEFQRIATSGMAESANRTMQRIVSAILPICVHLRNLRTMNLRMIHPDKQLTRDRAWKCALTDGG